MSTAYRTILAEVSVRCNALVGALPATLETNYTTSPLTTTQIESSIFPYSAIKDAILDTEGKLAWAVADTRAHPWRQYFSDQTAALGSPETLPSQSGSGAPIIGAWGEVTDESNGLVCSEMPLDVVRRMLIQITTGYSVIPLYWFNITAGRITHTRNNVNIYCCVYNRATQATALTGNGNILLPDALAQAYVAGTVATLVRDDEFVQQSQVYRDYFNNALDSISKGLTLVNSAPQLEGVAA